jgi:NADH:ubiquinone oxidoreductase subunit E
MKKITVTICTGTTCYIMGASHLQRLEDELTPDLRQRVEIVGSHCLGRCEADAHGQAPFVKVNDRLIAEATIQRVLAAIQDEL